MPPLDDETRRFYRQFALIVAAVAVGTIGWRAGPYIADAVFGPGGEPRAVTPRGDLAAFERTVIETFETARDSVVYVETTQAARDPWTRGTLEIPRGAGSGFVWDRRGHVVTNHHVVAGAASATIRLADGRAFAASLVGTSPEHDLAVLRIGVGVDRPPPLPIGESATLRVGQAVVAIGNPFGLDWTLTTGIVSALDRTLPSEGGRSIRGLVQTDAAINPGNSGGPLLDSAGRLIGVNTAIFSPSGASAGIGFAVPVDTVNRVVPQLIARGDYAPPRIGIEIDRRLNDRIGARTGVEGVFVLRVLPGSPAEAAGLEGLSRGPDGGFAPGDAIRAVAGRPVRTPDDLLAALERHEPGDRVALTLWRNGSEREVDVTLAPGRG
ncbi:MAG: S1C family serine protease [Pikeienuella sp.]